MAPSEPGSDGGSFELIPSLFNETLAERRARGRAFGKLAQSVKQVKAFRRGE